MLILPNPCTSGSGNSSGRGQEHGTAAGLATLHVGSIGNPLSSSSVDALAISRDGYGPVYDHVK